MKAAIIYASVHHENTKKVVEAIAGENAVDLIDAIWRRLFRYFKTAAMMRSLN